MSEKTLWQQYKEKNQHIINDTESKTVKPWDLLNPNTDYAEDLVAKDRLSICQSCPELIKLTSQCKKCGCFMKLKTKLLHATCPLDKW
jgi:hypothetical protein